VCIDLRHYDTLEIEVIQLGLQKPRKPLPISNSWDVVSLHFWVHQSGLWKLLEEIVGVGLLRGPMPFLFPNQQCQRTERYHIPVCYEHL